MQSLAEFTSGTGTQCRAARRAAACDMRYVQRGKSRDFPENFRAQRKTSQASSTVLALLLREDGQPSSNNPGKL